MLTRYIVSLLILFIAVSCDSDSMRRIKLADSIMEEHPDSAMSILEGIDRQALDRKTLPYYALLFTQAQVKTDIPLSSDSLISISWHKYGSDRKGDKGIRSNFYMGEVRYNQKKHRDAVRYYLNAYEESKRIDNDYWRAKSAERLGDIYFFAYNYDEAERWAKEAADFYLKANRLLNHRYLLGELGIFMINNNKQERAYNLLDSLYNICLDEVPEDSSLLSYVRSPMIDILVAAGKTDQLTEYDFGLLEGGNVDGEKLENTLLLSRIQDQQGNLAEGRAMLEEAECYASSSDDKVHLLYARYLNAKDMGDERLLLSILDSLLYYQSVVTEDIIKESITGAGRDFYSEMSVRNEEKSGFFRNLLIVSVTVSIIVILLIYIIFLYRRKADRAILASNRESMMALKDAADRMKDENQTLGNVVKEKDGIIQQLLEESEDKDLKNSHHNNVVVGLLKEKWSTFNMLCDQLYNIDQTDSERKRIIRNIDKELKKIVSPEGIGEISEAVDRYMDGIVTRLRMQCAFLKDDDIRFLSLLYAGFSVRAVCMFTGIRYEYFYVKKSRLIKRIQESVAPDKYLFIEKMK